MIRLEALRAFVEVADHGNIKDASERLFRTPSALSMTLKQIEDRLGCPLFETDRKSSLTDMGRFLYDQAVVLLRDYDRAMERIDAQSKARSGRLRIASVPSVATMLLPAFLQEFISTRPDLDVELVDTDSTDVRLLVETGQVDLGIAGFSADQPGIATRPVFRDPFLLVCRTDSLLAAKGPVLDWDDLKGQSLIVNEAARGLPSDGFQALVREARFSVRNVASLIAMVQSGMGVTLLPALATVNLPAALTARSLRDPACLRTVSLLWRAGRVHSPVAQRFLQDFVLAARQTTRSLGLEAMG
ncbi:LysR family transcriptional regulator [Paragemmobacter ruber]|uniref:LysR family transcriptional regulator n=1 Tax=Paragemmobacter ruber TaxID=1985673 RepID=A0ABW9YB90_9RHOB|nr:LysR family transcriptional regulator [Rhodobacter ruber]NBE09079.1 LysR family transcriptional regulator [Rhodobacter ruber]